MSTEHTTLAIKIDEESLGDIAAGHSPKSNAKFSHILMQYPYAGQDLYYVGNSRTEYAEMPTEGCVMTLSELAKRYVFNEGSAKTPGWFRITKKKAMAAIKISEANRPKIAARCKELTGKQITELINEARIYSMDNRATVLFAVDDLDPRGNTQVVAESYLKIHFNFNMVDDNWFEIDRK